MKSVNAAGKIFLLVSMIAVAFGMNDAASKVRVDLFVMALCPGLDMEGIANLFCRCLCL